MKAILTALFTTLSMLCYSHLNFASETLSVKAAFRLEAPLYTMKDGKLSGIDADISALLFSKEANIHLVYGTPTTWAEAVESVKNGVNNVVAGATETEERKAWAIFSAPYRSEEHVVLISKDQEANFDTASKFFEYVKAKKLSVQILKGVAYNSDEINMKIKNPDGIVFVEHHDNSSIINAVASDQNKVGIVNSLVYSSLKKDELLKTVSIGASKPQHFMFKKTPENEAIVIRLNAQIKALSEKIKQILAK